MGHSNIREVDYASGRNLMIFLGTRTPNSQVRRFQPGVKVLDPYRPGRILESVEGYCAVACLGLAAVREAQACNCTVALHTLQDAPWAVGIQDLNARLEPANLRIRRTCPQKDHE